MNSEPVIATLFGLLGLVPRNWAWRLSDVIGRIMFLADKKHRNIALDNLSHAFSNEKNPTEIEILARQVFGNLVRIVFEIGWSLRLERKNFSNDFSIKGLSNIRDTYEKNKGVLILTAHVGNWELLTIIAAMTGYPTSIVVRPLDFGPLEEFFKRLRTRFGGRLIPTKHSMRMVLTSLKAGDMVALLMDQNVDWYDGVFVDFFGRAACTNKGLALLALKTGAPVVPAFLVREPFAFKAEFGPEVPLIRTGDKTKDIEANSQQYNNVIEAFVRRYPDQWFWVHQRWKTKPYHPWPRG